MYLLLSVSIFLCGPVLAGLLPYLLRRTSLAPYFRSLGKPRHEPGFHPVLMEPPRIEPGPGHRRFGLAGAVIAAPIVALTVLTQAFPGDRLADCILLRNVFLGGLAAGFLLFTALVFAKRGLAEHQASSLLRQLGFVGVWQGSESKRVPFARSILESIEKSRSLDAIGTDGMRFLKLLSDPDHPPFTAPHPLLRGARVRLLLLPPRSYRIDPERRRLTCAEEALSRLERSPEEHWRQLNHSLEIRNRWAEEHQVTVDIRFLEERPAFSTIRVGGRTWFKPWDASRTLWVEVREERRGQRLVSAFRDHFVGAWSSASQEISFPLTPGPTGSTFIRKGVSPRADAFEETQLA